MANSVKVSMIGDKKFTANVVKVLRRALDKPTLDACGEEIVKLNQQAVRRGEAIGNSSKLPSNSDAWVKRRKFLSQFNNTGEAYGPKKSNLTFTGQLIRAITHKSNSGKMELEIFIKSSKREPYKGPKGPIGNRNLSNQKLGEYIADKGIIFVGLTLQAKVRCNEIIKRRVRSLMRLFK